MFEEFIEQLLPFCGRWLEPKSVLVMDNASFYHTERIEQMCHDAGVKLVYLPPYSPDLNPIEEFFAELKAFIKRHWQIYEDYPEQGFDTFLEWCIGVNGPTRFFETVILKSDKTGFWLGSRLAVTRKLKYCYGLTLRHPALWLLALNWLALDGRRHLSENCGRKLWTRCFSYCPHLGPLWDCHRIATQPERAIQHHF